HIASELTLSFIGFDGKKIDKDIVLKKELKPDSSSILYSSPVEALPKEKNSYAVIASLSYSGGSITATAFPALYKHCELLEPEISYELAEKETKTGRVFEIVLNAKNPAFFVGLDAGSSKGVFSDNLFTLLPSKKCKIVFTPENKKVTFSKFKKEFTVYNLRGTY
nr:hypothetical protein [Spirochaetaceae bacterium]